MTFGKGREEPGLSSQVSVWSGPTLPPPLWSSLNALDVCLFSVFHEASFHPRSRLSPERSSGGFLQAFLWEHLEAARRLKVPVFHICISERLTPFVSGVGVRSFLLFLLPPLPSSHPHVVSVRGVSDALSSVALVHALRQL